MEELLRIGISRRYYNEFDAIKATHPKMCPVQYVDGRFPDFPKINNSDFSTDGSNDLIDSFPNAERLDCFGRITEKINYSFQKASEFDVVILLACDEYITGNWNAFVAELEGLLEEEPNKRKLYVPFEVISGDLRPMASKDRIFADPSNWSVKGYHWMYYYKNQKSQVKDLMESPDITSIKIVHDDRVRDPARNKLMKDYQNVGENITG